MVTAHRRQSLASVSGAFLCPPGAAGSGDGSGGGNHQSLLNSTDLPPSGYNRERRRNSYAAGPIPELCVQSPEMSPTLTQQLGPAGQYGSHLLAPSGSFRRRLPPTPLDLANGRHSGSQETLQTEDGGSVRRTSSPRVLPTPPPSHHLPPQLQQPFSPSATSATPSPPSGWNDGGITSPQPSMCSSPFERRRSIRRQLPPEPIQHQQSQPQFELAALEQQQQQQHLNKLAVNGNGILQRSSSTRSTRRQSARCANLPPVPRQQQSLEVDNNIPTINNANHNSPIVHNNANANVNCPTSAAAAMPPIGSSAAAGPRLSRTASAAVTTMKRRSLTAAIASAAPEISPLISNGEKAPRKKSPMIEMEITGINEEEKPKQQNPTKMAANYPLENHNNNNNGSSRSNANANGINANGPINIIPPVHPISVASDAAPPPQNSNGTSLVGSCNSGKISPPASAAALSAPAAHHPTAIASAPTSPRDQQSAASAASGPISSPSPVRKYSSDSPSVLSDMAAISSLNLKRNGSGSMAHLLEQQHILRREFTANPTTAATNNSNSEGGGRQSSNSNSSSLSPSIEQLNCTVASRSGSDAEIIADPSVLGFDPSLYTTNGTSNGGSHCSGSAHSINSASFPSSEQATTSGEDSSHPRPKGLGLLHCTLQHFPVRKRLRVNVLKIEGLAGELRPDLEIQPYCKLNLTPGKKQQQQSVVKRGRDPVFNHEFFFDAIATEEIELKHLQIEVCHSSNQKLHGKDQEIGEVRIALRDLVQQLQTKKEVRIVEELKLFSTSKKLGRLHISTCIEKEARRLTINLSKAEDLPKWGIVGAPDVQIRIKMQQGNGPEVIKSSRVLKNTTSAVYKEAVMFLIGTKEADLARTKITISVHDLSRSVTGNDVIGSVYLGELAMDKSEIEQWKNTMDHWGKEYKGVHSLKGPAGQNPPDVHVSDVQDEDGGSDG